MDTAPALNFKLGTNKFYTLTFQIPVVIIALKGVFTWAGITLMRALMHVLAWLMPIEKILKK